MVIGCMQMKLKHAKINAYLHTAKYSACTYSKPYCNGVVGGIKKYGNKYVFTH